MRYLFTDVPAELRALLFFTLGACIAPWLVDWMLRLAGRGSRRSNCPACGRPFPVIHRAPAIGYLLARGRCQRTSDTSKRFEASSAIGLGDRSRDLGAPAGRRVAGGATLRGLELRVGQHGRIPGSRLGAKSVGARGRSNGPARRLRAGVGADSRQTADEGHQLRLAGKPVFGILIRSQWAVARSTVPFGTKNGSSKK